MNFPSLPAQFSQPGFRAGQWIAQMRFVGLMAAFLSIGIAQASEWSTGFEIAEGFVAGRPAISGSIKVMGGQAVVVAGPAAEGNQFLHFTPEQKENALVFVLTDEAATSRDRAIRFAFRLSGDPGKSRLVLSCGQTVAIWPMVNAVELEVGDRDIRRLVVPSAPEAWVRLEIREDAATQSWNLSVNGSPALTGLRISDHQEKISDVLIFSDGMLDLDALSVTTAVSALPPVADSVPPKAKINGSTPGPRPGDAAWDKYYNDTVNASIQHALRGDVAEIKDLFAEMSSAKKGSAQWHLERAQFLAMVAHVVHDSGHYRQAMIVAAEALKESSAADAKLVPADDQALLARSAFLAGRMQESIFADPIDAERHYRRAVTVDASFNAAKESAEQLASRSKPSRGLGK